ncbi:MAG: 3'(2'),5'-bisphosphate nucleotidase [Chloroflexi bacterium]|nr:3'(2'),5'-bisphosphate nucleotidase [Chloroflexota bacterium]
MTSYQRERTTAVEAARLAGRLCMAIREEMLKDHSFMEKAGHEPVTIADFGAQAVILQHIAAQFGEDATLAEERADDLARLAGEAEQQGIIRHVGAVLGRDVRLDEIASWLDFGREHKSSRVWVVDPIDGTKGFLRGDQFAIAVSLLVDGKPVVGVLACPMMHFGSNGATNPRGVLAVAVRGAGTVIEPLDGGTQRPATVSARQDPAEARVVESVEVGHHAHSFSERVMDLSGVHGQPVRIDSQAKYVAVADGRAEIYIRRARDGYSERVWDHAAGVLIVEEAGGRVTDLLGKPIDFTHGARLEHNRGILATNGPLHDDVLAAIQQAAQEQGG